MRASGLPRLADGLDWYVDGYDPAVHAYHWTVWALPGLSMELYLQSTEADLERMAEHRARMIDSVARQGGQSAKLSAAILDLMR